jgi:ubiquinone/menaquinone biosynthesis C-methylase UbiE
MYNQNKESWNKHAERFYKEDHRPIDYVDYCGEIFPSEKELKIIGHVNGLRVLEIGAGTCNCGIALAKMGAIVTCLDISEEQLKIGHDVAKNEKVKINTIISDMTDLACITSSSIDLVISMSAIMYVENYLNVFLEVNRVLKNNGRFIYSTDHPFLMSMGATELWADENANPSYMYRGPVSWKWKEEDAFYFTTYRKPLMDHINGLAINGFTINRLEELLPMQIDLNWDENEKKIRMRYPSVIVIEAIKNKW